MACTTGHKAMVRVVIPYYHGKPLDSSPRDVMQKLSSGVVRNAFATCCVSVCAFQTRVLGTLCVPSSGETKALLSFADVNLYLLVFPHEKNGA